MERDHDEPIAGGTGLDGRDDEPAMRAAKDLTDSDGSEDEASGDERTAVEGLGGIGATHRAWGGGSVNRAGGVGTHVPTDDDEHALSPDIDASEEATESTDPRGY